MKTSEKIAIQVIKIPRKLGNSDNISVHDLLEKTGYFQNYKRVSAGDIRKALDQCSECIDDWITYSENKRSGGWYFIQDEQGNFVVGCLDSNAADSRKHKYKNQIDACACFIKHEIEGIRRNRK